MIQLFIYKHTIITKLVILFLTGVLTSLSQAGVSLTTIDSFRINNIGSHSLMISKKSDTPDSQAFFSFLMHRPFCLCEAPSFVLDTPDSVGFERPLEDSYIKGLLTYDLERIQEVEFSIYLARPNRGNNVIRPINFPSLREVKVLDIETVYGNDRFSLKGFSNVMKQSSNMCQSFIPYEPEPEPEAEEMNV